MKRGDCETIQRLVEAASDCRVGRFSKRVKKKIHLWKARDWHASRTTNAGASRRTV